MIKITHKAQIKVLSAFFCLTFISSIEASTIVPTYQMSYLIGGEDVTDEIKLNFDAAAAWWMAALPTDKINLEISVELANLGGDNSAGLATFLEKDDSSGFITKGRADFNGNTDKWFFDATPHDNSEFNMVSSDLNTNPATPDTVNSGRFGNAELMEAQGNWDFLSVAKHEIGHLLGIGFNAGDPADFVLYENEVILDDDIDIDPNFATLFPNNILPVLEVPIFGSHFDGIPVGGAFNNTLMADPGFGLGMRTIQSDLDILAIGSVYDLETNDIQLNPGHNVPEPATNGLLLLTLGAAGVMKMRARKREEEKTGEVSV